MPRKKNSDPMDYSADQLTLVCKKCGGKKVHTVIFVKVVVHHLRCTTCQTVRAFQLEKGVSDEVFDATALDLEAVRVQADQKAIHPYNSRVRFSDGEFISHQTFGEGYVLAVYHPPVKMVVLFADRSRILVCGAWSRAESERAADMDSEVPDEDDQTPDGNKATCPTCGRKVHPYNLSRTTDGKTTNGCTFCVLG